jgi:hypothetical protein
MRSYQRIDRTIVKRQSNGRIGVMNNRFEASLQRLRESTKEIATRLLVFGGDIEKDILVVRARAKRFDIV